MQPLAHPCKHAYQAEIWLIRHGQTDWNQEGRYQGQTDIPLNNNGIQQAQELALKLEGLHFASIYSSDLQRALTTAQIIAGRLGLPLMIDPRLREIHQGQWEGMLFSEVARRFPREIALRHIDPLSARPPGGESVQEVAQRVAAAANDIAQKHPGQRVIIASHGLAIATLLARANHHTLKSVFSLIPDNASISVICWPPENNDRSHE
jgi:probable phosphoglycerate mutase